MLSTTQFCLQMMQFPPWKQLQQYSNYINQNRYEYAKVSQ